MSYLQELHKAHKKRQRAVWNPPCLAKPPVPQKLKTVTVRPQKDECPSDQGFRYPTIAKIIGAVTRFTGVTVVDILSARRTANVVRPRQIACYLAKMLTLRSLPEIGRRMGGRDHTTILHAIRKIERLIQIDPVLAREIDYLKSILISEPASAGTYPTSNHSRGRQSLHGGFGA